MKVFLSHVEVFVSCSGEKNPGVAAVLPLDRDSREYQVAEP